MVTISLQLPDELGAKVSEEARRRSLPTEKYLLELVSQTFEGSSDLERKLNVLRDLDFMGDDEEQRETFDILRRTVDEDRLSERKRFL